MDVNIFEELNNNVEQEEVKVEKKEKVNRSEINKAQAILEADIKEDPSLKERIHCDSDKIAVINTLAFGASGGLIPDKEAMAQSDEDKRIVQEVSKIYGYKIQNVGDEPIKYRTAKWSLDDKGVYVETKVEKTLAPGETANLSRVYMAMLGARPEFANVFANGRLNRSPSSKKANGDIIALLESHHFAFRAITDEDGNEIKKGVHDADVKINISTKNEEGKYEVLPEYLEDFGFLNNETKKTATKRGKKLNAQDAIAYMTYKAIQESNL